MKAICAVAILFCMANSAHATSEAAGVGVRTCAQFAKDYQNNPVNAELVYNNWGLGWLSGMNAAVQAVGKPQRDLAGMSFEDKKRFMREYCDNHPLQLYLMGVLEMFGSLSLISESGK
jgi:hypothetical protein